MKIADIIHMATIPSGNKSRISSQSAPDTKSTDVSFYNRFSILSDKNEMDPFPPLLYHNNFLVLFRKSDMDLQLWTKQREGHRCGHLKTTDRAAETETETTKPGCPGQNTTGNFSKLSDEIILLIVRQLDRCSSTCFGLGCPKIYDIHFEIYGLTNLNERCGKRRLYIAPNPPYSYTYIDYTSESEFLRDKIATWKVLRRHEFCWKYYLMHPKGLGWICFNWLQKDMETDREGYERALVRQERNGDSKKQQRAEDGYVI